MHSFSGDYSSQGLLQSNQNRIQNQKKKLEQIRDEQDDLQEPSKFSGQAANHSDMLRITIYEYYTVVARLQNCLLNPIQFLKGKDQRKSHVENINDQKGLIGIDTSMKNQDALNEKIIQLKILEVTNLELDRYVIHPFIRIHIVNQDNGVYLQKVPLKSENSKITNFESAIYGNDVSYKQVATHQIPNLKMELLTYYDSTKNNENVAIPDYFSHSKLNFVPAFATGNCDLRINGNSKATWNQNFQINVPANTIYHENTVILFELLDFNGKLLREKNEDLLDHENFYRIAYGYFKPFGIAKNHTGKIKVQLYKYCFQSRLMKETKFFVPSVYYDFIWPTKQKYDGMIEIQINPIQKPDMYIQNTKDQLNVFEVEGEVLDDQRKEIQDIRPEIKDEIQPLSEKEKAKQKRSRAENEQSIVPDKLLCKFSSDQQGCLRLEFSNNGNFLAAACTQKNSRTYIKIFDVQDQMKEVFRYRGHRNLIHELNWSLNDNYLVSCSSDFTARVWKIPFETNDEIDEDQSEREYLLSTLIHPSYVYSAKFHPKCSKADLYIATACFDAKVRIFYVNKKFRGRDETKPQAELIVSMANEMDSGSSLIGHRHPNSLCFDSNGKLFVGDSLGVIHVWGIYNVNALEKKKIDVIVEDTELLGDSINKVYWNPQFRSGLIVHSKDNCIRVLQINTNSNPSIKVRCFGSITNKFPIHSTISPCGGYILSGSEDGKPHIWDTVSGEPKDITQCDYEIEGPLADVSWSTNYNMVAMAGFGDEYPINVYCYEKQSDPNKEGFIKLNEEINQEDKNQELEDQGKNTRYEMTRQFR